MTKLSKEQLDLGFHTILNTVLRYLLQMDSTSFQFNNEAARATFNKLEANMTKLSKEQLDLGFHTVLRHLLQLDSIIVSNSTIGLQEPP